jgi:exodeoxyribonuclease III
MRIATWNVNSLKARLEKVTWWLDRAKPDVLLMQETKLADADVPAAVFRQADYALVHHGEGRWNGVAIASRCGIDAVVTNFGEPLRPVLLTRWHSAGRLGRLGSHPQPELRAS